MSALILLANSLAVAPNTPLPFSGSGGTAPYSYSVQSGGAGGSIDPSTGLYVAPPVLGSDTIQVADAEGNTAQSDVLIGSALELLCDIIEKEMGLENGQVYLYNQKINIPSDSRLYIAVGVLSPKPFSNSNKMVESDFGLNSVQSVNMQALVSIDILSRSTEALNRKEEVILALNGNYAQSQQELNSFYLGKITTGFTNLSEIDGAAIDYRFNLSLNIQYTITKTKAVDYFDTFDSPEVVTSS